MIRKLIVFFILIAPAFAQRYDNFASTVASASGIGNLMQVIPNATITVCNFPGTGGTPCTNKATTYTSQTLITSCAPGQQVVLQGSFTCQTTSDNLGNFGFWASPGKYQYCISANNFTTQCYNIVVPVDPTAALNINNVLSLDGVHYAYTGAGLSQAVSDCIASSVCPGVDASGVPQTSVPLTISSAITLSKSGMFVRLPAGPAQSACSITSTAAEIFDVTAESVYIAGQGTRATNLCVNSASGDGIRIESGVIFTTIRDLGLATVTTNNTSGAAIHAIGGPVFIYNVQIQPFAYGVLCQVAGCQVKIDNLRIAGVDSTTTWIAGIWNCDISGSSTCTSSYYNNIIVTADSPFSNAGIVLGGGSDGIIMQNITMSNGASALTCMHFQNVAGNTRDPEWTSVVNLNCQPGATILSTTNDGVLIDAVRDVRFTSPWIQSGYHDVNINGGNGIKFYGGDLTATVRENVLISGGQDINFDGQRMGDGNSVGTTQTFANFHAGAASANWVLQNAYFKTIVLPAPCGSACPKNDLLIDNGAVSYIVKHNAFQSTGTVAPVLDSSGASPHIYDGNLPTGAISNWTPGQSQFANNIFFTSNSVLLMSVTAPTIAAAGCGGAAASIVANNGTAAFKVNVGTTPTSACTITMPAATTGWNCNAEDITTQTTNVFVQKQTGAESTTQVVITNFSDVAAATAFVASDILKVTCSAD